MRLVLLGPPGSGKGTQGPLLAERFSIPVISTGDILRDHVRRGTALGQKADPYMSAGNLVPDEVIIGIIRERLEEPDTRDGFILDGFPRTVPQAEALDAMLEAEAKPIDRALYLKVSQSVLEQRLGGRWTCSCCGRVFSNEEPPRREGVCDDDGTELMQREDDRPEVVKHRVEVYLEETRPVVDYYREQAKIAELDGERSVEEVRGQWEEALDHMGATA